MCFIELYLDSLLFLFYFSISFYYISKKLYSILFRVLLMSIILIKNQNFYHYKVLIKANHRCQISFFYYTNNRLYDILYSSMSIFML